MFLTVDDLFQTEPAPVEFTNLSGTIAKLSDNGMVEIGYTALLCLTNN